jgi:hypothetical protein
MSGIGQVKFHPDKCTVLRVTNKKKTIDAKYQLHGHTLESVTSAKYLGLTFTNKLQWDQHINKSPGPRTEPWGTPESTLTASEVDPSITTDCFLFASQFCIHLTDFPIIP